MSEHAMDVPLAPAKRARSWKIVAPLALAAVVFALIAFRGASPRVAADRQSVVTARVERGTLTREARGTGTLIAARSAIVAAETSGRVEAILVHAGQTIDAASPLVVLANPEAQEQEADAQAALDSARAELTAARALIEQQVLALRAENARLQGEATEARARAESLARLAGEGLAASTEVRLAAAKAETLDQRAAFARQMVAAATSGVDAQLSAKAANVQQAEARYELRRRATESLHVAARIAGVVQEVVVEPGQRVVQGDTLARVSDPSVLVARIHVPPAQARDIAPGQGATIDTHAGIVHGRVARLDPAVRDGSVTVDVNLTEALPAGVRTDSAVEATIVLGAARDVLTLRRPANVDDGSSVQLFRVDGKEAVRTEVSLGRGSASAIEVLGGLAAGDEVIVSDTSAWRDEKRVAFR